MEAAAFIDLRRRGTALDDFVPVVLLSLRQISRIHILSANLPTVLRDMGEQTAELFPRRASRLCCR